MRILDLPVTVLNADFEPLEEVNVRKAIKKINRGVVYIHDAYEGLTIGPFVVPRTIVNVNYIFPKWRNRGPRWSKRMLHKRDRRKCAYCGKVAKTVDHVVPKSQGGKTTWDNTVSACFPCNNKKDNRTPKEAGMRLLWEPYEPTWWEMHGVID